jgi:hypothetical protein
MPAAGAGRHELSVNDVQIVSLLFMLFLCMFGASTRPRTGDPMRPHRRTLALAVPLLTLCALLVFARSGDAHAEVVHGTGYEATVAGWTSWYGSYQLFGVGQTWCIDHGLQAPDAVFGYRPIPPPAIPVTSQTAMAWILGRYGNAPSAIDAAAIMLVLHDLNGAVYPQGALVVDRLAPSQFAGFGGAEAAVRGRAVQLKSDGLAHAGVRGPLSLSLAAPAEVAVGQVSTVTARIRDAAGHGVAGLPVSIHALGASPTSSNGTTGADGSFSMRAIATASTFFLTADAVVPSMRLDVYGPAGAPAQRVAKSTATSLHARAEVRPRQARLRIHKTGDLTPRFPVTGARFVVTTSTGQMVGPTLEAGADGMTPWVSLPIGRYTVSESVAPPGYQRAQPVTVDLTAADRTLEILDHVRRPTLELRKVDASTGAPLAGAVLRLWADPEGDGTFTPIGLPLTTTKAPIDITTLLPGNYRVTEVRPPDGYAPFTPRTVHLDPGTQAELVLPDRRLPPVTLIPPTSISRPVPPTTSTAPPTTRPSNTTSTRPAPPTTAIIPPAMSPPSNGGTPSVELPRTGAATRPLAEMGMGFLVLGASLVIEAGRTHRRSRSDR